MSAADLNNLSINELKKLVKKEYNENKKTKGKKQKLIEVYQKLQKQNNKQRKQKPTKQKPKKSILKHFEEYFQKCIKNKTIPADTPPYLRRLSNEL